jgi:cbb3-type cytochrome oxidase subunit 3
MNVQLQEEPKWVRLCRILKKKNLTYSIMIPMDRETLMMVATIVAIAGVIFLFREMNKAKQDVDNLKNFSAQLIQKLSAPVPMPRPAPQVEPTEEPETELETIEEKKEE